ncbi:hypothetical protein B0H10DRAFT_2214525 [Mycena sp. CBHHK59/15]|nr:hypothetical protein B0H10DRAFT_2214525 [Mycena sp. CBHHK59/15]
MSLIPVKEATSNKKHCSDLSSDDSEEHEVEFQMVDKEGDKSYSQSRSDEWIDTRMQTPSPPPRPLSSELINDFQDPNPPPNTPPHRDGAECAPECEPQVQEPESQIEEFRITNKFIDALRHAHLDNPEELNPDIIERLKNPPQYTPTLNTDKHLSIDLFLSVSNASEETYNSVRTAVMRRHPDDDILSYYQVKKLVAELSGVS